MPKYDAVPPLKYDTGVRYASEGAPTKKTKNMAKIARNWNRLPIKLRRDFFQGVIDKLTGNADVPTPKPTLAELGAQMTKMNATIKAVDDLELAIKAARSAMHDEIDAMAAMIGLEVPTVESATSGDKTMMLGAGFAVVDSDQAPAGTVGKPERFHVTASDFDGALDMGCDRDPAAKSYEGETTTTPDVESSYKRHTVTTKSSMTATGLTSGTRVYSRMRGIGPNGPGPWSDVVSKIVP